MSRLRAAGLVRVHLSEGEGGEKAKTYALRTQALDSAGAFLDTYVRIEPTTPRRIGEAST